MHRSMTLLAQHHPIGRVIIIMVAVDMVHLQPHPTPARLALLAPQWQLPIVIHHQNRTSSPR
jgi:hypothetical protein